MNRFGFSISKGRLIDYDLNDHSLEALVLASEPSLSLCIACGSCAATCTSGKHNGFSLRRINISLRRGENDVIRKEIAQCMMCGKCTLLCPRGVNTRNLIFSIRNNLRRLESHEE